MVSFRVSFPYLLHPFFAGAFVFCYVNETVTKFISRVVKDSNKLLVQKEELSLEAVKQYKVYCPDELTKIDVIKTKILELGERLGQSIIFVRTKASARMLHQQLVEEGYSVTTIHGATTADDRDKIVRV